MKFCSVSSFEFNPAISLLDILQIKLYHLWIIDSSEPNYAIIKDLSYNQLVEKSFTDEDCKGNATLFGSYKFGDRFIPWTYGIYFI